MSSLLKPDATPAAAIGSSFFFQAEDGIRDLTVTGVQTCALPIFFAASCYKDDTTSPRNGKSLARVLLTDAPFPYDSVARVNVYVASIDASSDLDTTGGGQWVRAATPARAFDLLTLQRGATAFLGEAELDARPYPAIRMVIDADTSSTVYNNGAAPPVHWPWPGSGAVTMYALIEEPLDFSTAA